MGALLNLENNYRIIVKTRGGGLTGQTGAIQLGLARALCKIDPNYRSTLKLAGLLTRDSRQVERKKIWFEKSSKSFTIFKTLIHIPLVIKLVLCQKKDIHPEWYDNTEVYCDGKLVYTVSSTKEKLNVDIWSGNHPFYTGSKKLLDTEGRVDRFMKKYNLEKK